MFNFRSATLLKFGIHLMKFSVARFDTTLNKTNELPLNCIQFTGCFTAKEKGAQQLLG